MSEMRRLQREAKHWRDRANAVSDPILKAMMETLAVETQVIAAEIEINQVRTVNRALGAW